MKSGKQKILAVDDHPVNLKLIEELLRNDYEILTATNGADALRICAEESIDLVLLDIIMPEMDGYDVCKILKASPVTKQIPIIFLTAKAKTEDIVQGFEVGGVDYVTKPFNGSELCARVKTHVELKILKGILPFCCVCGLIRDDTGVEQGKGEWIKVDKFIRRKTDASISHCYCPMCYDKL
jgi:CheY-like chemotaxis protein